LTAASRIVDKEQRPAGGEEARSRVGGTLPSSCWSTGQTEATTAKYAGDWLLTATSADNESKATSSYKSRDDDVITSGGYRIGPGEIEECMMKASRRAMVGVGRTDKVSPRS